MGRLRLQATCEAIASGYLQGEPMARFLTSQFPYDSEQLDSALSRGELDWPRDHCGMDQSSMSRNTNVMRCCLAPLGAPYRPCGCGSQKFDETLCQGGGGDRA